MVKCKWRSEFEMVRFIGENIIEINEFLESTVEYHDTQAVISYGGYKQNLNIEDCVIKDDKGSVEIIPGSVFDDNFEIIKE